MREEELIERLATLECICSYIQDLLCEANSMGLTLEDSTGSDAIGPCHNYLHTYAETYPTMVETPEGRRRRINYFIKEYNDNC